MLLLLLSLVACNVLLVACCLLLVVAVVFVVVFVVVQFDVDVVVNVENVVAVCRFCCYLSCSRLAGNAANVL